MPERRQAIRESLELRERVDALEATYRATLNILEDFDEEKAKFGRIQQAMINLLEDSEEERRKFQLLQRATLNLLEDVNEEREKFSLIQKATLNLLEDFDEERSKLHDTQRALMNIVEDTEVERARAERARTLVESANKELESFSYSVSHDLKAPLRAISGFVQALVEDCEPVLDDEGKRYLALIQENAHRMGRLIEDLLAFSRLGRLEMTDTDIDMEGLAKEVFEELSADAAKRKVRFRSYPVPPAHGDRAMIRQVLANLISNAVKFTKTREEALIEFGWLPERRAYYVKDNGVGFDMRYGDKLFGVFQRLHSVREFEGTGVGLALVYRIVTRHGGNVWAQADVDGGATFYFTLSERRDDNEEKQRSRNTDRGR